MKQSYNELEYDCMSISYSGERVTDITFWKNELINEIRAMENETDNLQVDY